MKMKWMALTFFAVFSANAAEWFEGYPTLPDTPAYCFESETDAVVYAMYGDATPLPFTPEMEGRANSNWLRKAAENGPAKRTQIKISLKETQKDGMIYLDATGTTTPGPNPLFVWDDTPNSWNEDLRQISSRSGAPGTKGSMLLTVIDPVCKLKASQRINFTYR